MRKAFALGLALVAGFTACATEKLDGSVPALSGGDGGTVEPGPGPGAGGQAPAPDAGPPEDGGINFDAQGGEGGNFDPDAACAAVAEKAQAKLLPVDIIWVVDNSASMLPAIEQVTAGLNAFAAMIDGKSLDYRVIMLSLRSSTSPVMVGGKARYPVCIPQPLAGDPNCGDGARFFQSSIDIKSTQPLEQLLGTLGQTAGYTPGEEKGGDPWAAHLRPEATKTIVVVTDDNSRLSPTDFEKFPGGKNPFNSLKLPPGILDPSWNGLFKSYVFSGIYGWGSDVDPEVTCAYPDQSVPSSPGPTYSTLVSKTGGVRAKICEGQAAWQPFFDAVAQAVIETSKLSCELAIPQPSMGSIDYGKVNVNIPDGAAEEQLVRVDDASKCSDKGGWYYDDPAAPKQVILCPTSCEKAQAAVGPGQDVDISVLFGCESIVN